MQHLAAASKPSDTERAAGSSGSLCAGTFVAACGPHAPLRVVVVVKVAQSKPLHLQPCLQDPGTGGRDVRALVQVLWLRAALRLQGPGV